MIPAPQDVHLTPDMVRSLAECPICGAPKGERCWGMVGNPTAGMVGSYDNVHGSRERDARAALAQEAP